MPSLPGEAKSRRQRGLLTPYYSFTSSRRSWNGREPEGATGHESLAERFVVIPACFQPESRALFLDSGLRRNDDGDETMDDETFRDFRHSGNLQAGIHTFTVL